jgi:hypothetical protein
MGWTRAGGNADAAATPWPSLAAASRPACSAAGASANCGAWPRTQIRARAHTTPGVPALKTPQKPVLAESEKTRSKLGSSAPTQLSEAYGLDSGRRQKQFPPAASDSTVGSLRGCQGKPWISRMFSSLPRALRSASVPGGDRAAPNGGAKFRAHRSLTPLRAIPALSSAPDRGNNTRSFRLQLSEAYALRSFSRDSCHSAPQLPTLYQGNSVQNPRSVSSYLTQQSAGARRNLPRIYGLTLPQQRGARYHTTHYGLPRERGSPRAMHGGLGSL